MLVQCTLVYPRPSLSPRAIPSSNLFHPSPSSLSLSLSLRHLPILPRALSFGLFLRVRPSPPSPRSLYRRSMLSYPTDNSIILHAKTASDVLAQSASHLCEQITSYRKTDFIFEERWLRFFLLFPFPLFFLSLLFFWLIRALLDPPRIVSRFLVSSSIVFLLVSLFIVQWRTQLARLRLNGAVLSSNESARYHFPPPFLFFFLLILSRPAVARKCKRKRKI